MSTSTTVLSFILNAENFDSAKFESGRDEQYKTFLRLRIDNILMAQVVPFNGQFSRNLFQILILG